MKRRLAKGYKNFRRESLLATENRRIVPNGRVSFRAGLRSCRGPMRNIFGGAPRFTAKVSGIIEI